MRIKKGLVEMTVTKRVREGPSASSTYPIPAANVIALFFNFHFKTFSIEERSYDNSTPNWVFLGFDPRPI